MSKIGKINIEIPEKVKLVLNGSILQVDGPLGKSELNLDIEMFDLDINNEKKKYPLNQKKLTLHQKDYGE